MSEFWLCRDPNQLKDRIQFFEQWLRENWDGLDRLNGEQNHM